MIKILFTTIWLLQSKNLISKSLWKTISIPASTNISVKQNIIKDTAIQYRMITVNLTMQQYIEVNRKTSGNKDTIVILTVCVPHLLLPCSHISEIIDNWLRKVLQPLQLHLHWLQLLCFCNLNKRGNIKSQHFQNSLNEKHILKQNLKYI